MTLKSLRRADGLRDHETFRTRKARDGEKRGRGKASLTGYEHECQREVFEG